MPIKAAWLIADKLDITIDELVGRKDTSPMRVGLIQARYDKLSQEERNFIEDMMGFAQYRNRMREERMAHDAHWIDQNECMDYMHDFKAETGINPYSLGAEQASTVTAQFERYLADIFAAQTQEYLDLLNAAFDKRKNPQTMTRKEYQVFMRNPDLENATKTIFSKRMKTTKKSREDHDAKRVAALVSEFKWLCTQEVDINWVLENPSMYTVEELQQT